MTPGTLGLAGSALTGESSRTSGSSPGTGKLGTPGHWPLCTGAWGKSITVFSDAMTGRQAFLDGAEEACSTHTCTENWVSKAIVNKCECLSGHEIGVSS